MPEFPRVTIITPSYNQSDFLEQTIQSVLSQEYPNLEYFIIDGGSKDRSVEIIKKYADHLSWWVSERDKGQADAINKGFARATGEIVAWINSDDYYLPGALTSAVAALEAAPDVAMIFSDVVSVNTNGEPFNVMTYGNWTLEDLMQFKVIGQPGVFIRRKYLEQAGYLDMTYHLLLDHELWLRVAQQAPIRYIPQRWAAARVHPAAKNVAHAPDYGKDAYRIIAWMPSQPGLKDRYQRLRRRIWAGAYRLDAHYLLDAGQPGPALKAYIKGLWASPAVILPQYRRILFASASLFINVNRFRSAFLERRRKNTVDRLSKEKDSIEKN